MTCYAETFSNPMATIFTTVKGPAMIDILILLAGLAGVVLILKPWELK